MRDDDVRPWVLGGAMGLLSFLGLLLASAARDGVLHIIGLALFLLGVLIIFVLIHRHVGR